MLGHGGRARAARIAVRAALAASMVASAPSVASALEPDGSALSRAHDAYTRGAAAYAQGDYGRAAREFAAADALVPDPVTLRVALDAATLADDAVLGVELIARSSRGPVDGALAHQLSIARSRFRHRTGAIVVHCERCLVVIDGAPAKAGVATVVTVGIHTVTLQDSGAPAQQVINVAADETKDVAPIALPTPPPGEDGHASTRPPPNRVRRPPETPPPATGISPAWFVVAGSATAVLLGFTIWSVTDTASDHSNFQAQGCAQVATAACSQLASDGTSAQQRTAWLGAAAGATALGTAALGLFAVRWHQPQQSTPPLSIGLGDRAVWMHIAF